MEVTPVMPEFALSEATLRLQVNDAGHTGAARRAAAEWTRQHGCSEELAGRVLLVVSELAKNLELHTTAGGELLLRRFAGGRHGGVSVLALDRGPGVENFSHCLRDGYSTSGTAGIGLGAVQRIARTFEAHSVPGVGTAILAEVGEASGACGVGAVNVPAPGETECGDAWASVHGSEWSRHLVVDGLGHGPLAATAARAARDVFHATVGQSLGSVLRAMHDRLRSTRGAAAAIAHADLHTGRLLFAGVGNAAGTHLSEGRTSSLVPQNGTLGAAMPSTVREVSLPWKQGDRLVMQSDGLKSNWQLTRLPGLALRHPELLAGVLFRDFARGSDDATVLVARSTP